VLPQSLDRRKPEVWMRRLIPIIALAALAAFGPGSARPALTAAGRTDATVRSGARTSTRFVYPLKLSANRRYLVDQRGRPFLIVGDSPQALIGNLDLSDAASYIADRSSAGFNSLLIDLLCAKYTGCRDDGTTYDGIKPFTTPGDLATPNPAYFKRAAAVVQLAAKAGIVVFLDPIETGGWLPVLLSNGVEKDYEYGQFLARRFRSFSNIVWWSGNDFQSWSDPSDDAVALAVARGIKSVAPSALQTVELNYNDSGSLDDSRWQPYIGLDAAYTYLPTYARVLKEYDRARMPVFLGEAGYEFEQNSGAISYGDPVTLRRQEYWSVLSGADGQFYGNHYTWQFASGWKSHLDTLGSTDIGYLVRLFDGIPWYRLVPDQAHRIVTAGYGTFETSGSVDSSDYVTTAATPDGTLALSYLPAGGRITVDMSRFAGPVHAHWYDPAAGTYQITSGSPFPNSGAVSFTSPGTNAGGDPDWVLVLTASKRR
jgi:Protein of unknown function (DUF4038)/Putative collagen-binding domain of a collagenase